MSSIVSPSAANFTEIVTSSPQSGFCPSALRVGVGEHAVVVRVLVVVEDDLAVELVVHYANTSCARRTPAARRSISSGTV